MLSTHGEDILVFIQDFETSSRDYLESKGFSKNEMTNAYLDLQWNFLHTILKQQADKIHKNSQRHTSVSPYSPSRRLAISTPSHPWRCSNLERPCSSHGDATNLKRPV